MSIPELRKILGQRGVNPRRYDLDGGIPALSEGLTLAKDGERWLIRHFERGSWYTLGEYDTENEACEALLRYASDPFYQT